MIRGFAVIAALALASGAGAQDAPRHAPIIETPPEPGIVRGCGHYVVLASLPTLDAAFARQDALELAGTGVIDTDEVDTMADGLHAVVFGPFDTAERAARRRSEVLYRAPDAYVKAGCHDSATAVEGDGCLFLAIVGSERSRAAAQARIDDLGGDGLARLDSDGVPGLAPGLHVVSGGVFRSAAEAEAVVDGWRSAVPDAYVARSCDVEPVADPTPAVPLRRGVYERNRAACAAPALATLKVWDGAGVQSRNATNCTFRVESRAGDLYGGTNLCTDPATGAAVETGLSLRLAGPDRFRLVEIGGDGPFDYVRCPGAEAGFPKD